MVKHAFPHLPSLAISISATVAAVADRDYATR